MSVNNYAHKLKDSWTFMVVKFMHIVGPAASLLTTKFHICNSVQFLKFSWETKTYKTYVISLEKRSNIP